MSWPESSCHSQVTHSSVHLVSSTPPQSFSVQDRSPEVAHTGAGASVPTLGFFFCYCPVGLSSAMWQH